MKIKITSLVFIFIFSPLVQAQGLMSLELEKTIQRTSSNKAVGDLIFDDEIYSPKSVIFSSDNTKIYINSLEGYQTLVYSWPDLQKLKSISHIFNSQNSHLFLNNETTIFDNPYYTKRSNKNEFKGKPVESTLTHGGRFLWVPYYRRDYDKFSQSPSALAIIDTLTDQIVRVMPTGPIPKYVQSTPDGRYLSVTHWGDNTIALINIQSSDPFNFFYEKELTVGHKLDQSKIDITNRDGSSGCGYCLRGTVFTKDNKYMVVARMGGSNYGLAVFNMDTFEYVGTIKGFKVSPRHLVIDNQNNLFISLNRAGYISKIKIDESIRKLELSDSKLITLKSSTDLHQEKYIGSGARTIELSIDEKYLFVACKKSQKLFIIDSNTLEVVASSQTTPFPVGLDVSQDGAHVITTSQGYHGVGGNAVNIFRIEAH